MSLRNAIKQANMFQHAKDAIPALAGHGMQGALAGGLTGALTGEEGNRMESAGQGALAGGALGAGVGAAGSAGLSAMGAHPEQMQRALAEGTLLSKEQLLHALAKQEPMALAMNAGSVGGGIAMGRAHDHNKSAAYHTGYLTTKRQLNIPNRIY